MQKITTFLMFEDRAAEAMDFYVSIFKNGRIISTMSTPDGKVAGGMFELEGFLFMCYNGGPQFSFSEGMSQMISCESQEEIDHYYDRLSEGGSTQPCGWLRDKFGVSWQVIPPILTELLSDPDREKSGRAAQAMFKMNKIIIADLKAAAFDQKA